MHLIGVLCSTMFAFTYKCCVLILCLRYSFGARILAVFPHYGASHFMAFEPLMLELASRGHEVVVISRYPQSEKIENYFDIDVNNDIPVPNNNLPFYVFQSIPVSLQENLEALYR